MRSSATRAWPNHAYALPSAKVISTIILWNMASRASKVKKIQSLSDPEQKCSARMAPTFGLSGVNRKKAQANMGLPQTKNKRSLSASRHSSRDDPLDIYRPCGLPAQAKEIFRLPIPQRQSKSLFFWMAGESQSGQCAIVGRLGPKQFESGRADSNGRMNAPLEFVVTASAVLPSIASHLQRNG